MFVSRRYVFTLNYRKGQRAVQTSVSIKVVEGRPPEVVMRPQRSSKANPDRILTVSGYVTATMENTRIWWESVDEDGRFKPMKFHGCWVDCLQ